jgi:glutamate racemase
LTDSSSTPPHPSGEQALAHSNARGLVIGIRDSGVGGLTVARAVRQVLVGARILYFADTAHVPYGDREPDEVKFFALSISQFLLEQGAQALVFACNTTSAYALGAARERFPVPVTGMIEPGARAALEATRNNCVGVLATQATVDSNVYTQTVGTLRSSCSVREIGCPDFVPIVESERAESGAAIDAARKYLRPLLEAGCDTIILGCTHYPLLLPVLRAQAPHIRFIDPAHAVAREVAACTHHLVPRTQSTLEDTFFVSGEREGVRRWIQSLLGLPTPRLEAGPVFERSSNPARLHASTCVVSAHA